MRTCPQEVCLHNRDGVFIYSALSFWQPEQQPFILPSGSVFSSRLSFFSCSFPAREHQCLLRAAADKKDVVQVETNKFSVWTQTIPGAQRIGSGCGN